MSKALRQIVSARQSLPSLVKEALMPLEQTSHQHAEQAIDFTALLLSSHAAAGLPLAVGTDVIRLAQEASRHAIDSRAKLGELHEALRPIVDAYFPMGGAECPPNEGALITPITA